MDWTHTLIEDDFWPASLSHLAQLYVAPSDEYVVVGEVSSELASGYQGNRLIYTALVPREQAEEALQAVGGIGHGVRAHGPRPDVGKEGGYDSSFWINGPEASAARYEALVHTWRVHNRDVLIPDNGFLMCYGLTPRTLADGTIVWDDLSVPVYDVVRVKPESLYADGEHSTARIEILRDYIEDYLDLKGAVAIATQFEERWSVGDPLFDGIVGSGPGLTVELKGRTLWLKRIDGSSYGDQLSQVWCSRLILDPQKRPISSPEQISLKWPDHPTPIVGSGRLQGFGVMEEAFVRDEVLVPYENRAEFIVNPESGSVSYGGWWSVGYSRRAGRNHIALELRKLYEGAPFSVIQHYWKYAVSVDSVADSGQEKPAVNIGTRATRLVDAYLLFVRSVHHLCEAVGLSFSEEDIGSYSTADVKYHGWWRVAALSRLGNVSLLSMPYPTFLSRCKDVQRLLEGIKLAPLRNLASALGIKKTTVDPFGSLKLCAAVCQLATIAQAEGYALATDTAEIAARWDKDQRIPCFAPLFALHGLRLADAHTSSTVFPNDQLDNLKVFSIDVARYRSGWGEALDLVYDSVAKSLEEAGELISSTRL